jgi:twinkle protein
LINYKYRDREKNFRMEAQAERILFGYDDIDDNACMIVEGEMDKLTAEVAGLISCVSVPDGAPTPETKNYASKFTFLDDERLQNVQKWVIAVDNDPPGVRLEQELVRRLGVERCLKVTYPDGCKDLNEVATKLGTDAVVKIVASAVPYPVEGVIEVSALGAQLDLLYQSGRLKGLSTGWRLLDQYYTVRPREFTVVTGTPGSGKSNFMDDLMVNLAREHGWKFAVFSPENQPVEEHVSRLMEHFTRMPFWEGPTRRMDVEQMHVARDWVNEFFRFILPPDDADWTIEHILELALVLIRRHGINGLVIDPWNELDHSPQSGQTETQYISKALKRLRQYARRNAIGLWLVAHPQKLYRSRDTGQYPVPTLYDISGSAHFRNKADNGLIVARDFANPENPYVDIHTAKIRFRGIGKVGMCQLKYDKATGGYSDAQPAPVDPPDDEDDKLPYWAA